MKPLTKVSISGAKPNFFIVGAQKCGTTSLAMYLAEHPDIFLTNPKEPYYFATDFPHLRRATSEKEYLALFREANEKSKAIGEATAGYLFSKEAIQNIFNFNQKAKIIVMLRNPYDLIRSFHLHQQFAFNEDESDFSKAWVLQERRLRGEGVPRHCINPEVLQYREVGMLGKQVERLCSIFPRNQICFFLLDELASSPRAVYRQALEFLHVPDDGRMAFPRFNQKKAHRFVWFFSMLQPRPVWFQALIERVRGILGPKGWEKLLVLFVKKPESSTVPESLRDEIVTYYKDDVRLLAELTGKNLGSWCVISSDESDV